MLRILLINSVCGVGSTGRICTDLADEMNRLGHECKIAYARGDVPEKYKHYAVRIGNKNSVMRHALSARLFDNGGFCSTRETKKLIEQIKTFDPDIIHLHNLHGYYINIEILFKYLAAANKRIIWTLHDCWSFTGHCAYFEYIGCEKWKCGCGKCPQIGAYPKSYRDRSKKNYEKKKKAFSDINNMTLATPSKWLAELVDRSFMGKYPTEVIYNGIDTDVFKPTENSFRKENNIEDKKIILGVANIWEKRKGLDDLIKLSDMLSSDYKLVVVGKLPGGKLPENILHIERTDSVFELAGIYSAADVFVNPTYEDNYPTTNLEAQSCGTPVITYKTGGSVESVPAENVVPQGDINMMRKLIDTDLKIKDTCFDKKEMIKEYVKLYCVKNQNK